MGELASLTGVLGVREIFNIVWVALGERMGAEEEKLPRRGFI